jgi:hypothetical protein
MRLHSEPTMLHPGPTRLIDPSFLTLVIRLGIVELERQYKQGCELALTSPYLCHREVKSKVPATV